MPRHTKPHALTAAVAVLLAAIALTACQPTQGPTRQKLNTLTVAAPHTTGYDRALFPTWKSAGTLPGCDAREETLRTESVNPRPAVVNPTTCAIVQGTWYSPYDGNTWTNPADVDIDHVVPLANAWQSGAFSWTTAQRQAYANDVAHPETLIAVTDNVNQAKGDRSPDQWKPPLASYWCQYASDWVSVKVTWHLTVTAAEKTALNQMIDTCPA